MAELSNQSSFAQFDEGEVQTEVQEIKVDATQAYDRGKTDINFFAALMLPNIMAFELPPFYIASFNMLISRPENQMGKIIRFALGLPRGHAKTTFMKILMAWLIAYDRASFVLVICAVADLSDSFVEDVSNMLGSPNAEAIYGRWKDMLSTDRNGMKQALYHNRIVILAGKGAGQAVRGIVEDNKRPDCILCDDMQTRENDDSETERARLKRWMTATLFKTVAPRGNRLIIYVGNMYSEQCILYQLKKSPSWISLITGAILESGEPLWPQLHSLESLMESYIHDESIGEAEVWFAEVMNDPRNAATSLLLNELPICPFDLEATIPDGVFITIDPAGFRLSADDNVIVVHYIIDGKGVSIEADIGIKDPEELIIRALQLASEHGASAIGVEDVAYQQTLLFWFKKYIELHNITELQILPLSPHGRTKETRIRQFISELYQENWYLGPKVRAAFLWQALKYRLGAKKNKDDLLDACAYSMDIRNDHWASIYNVLTITVKRVLAKVQTDNTPF